MIPVSGSKLHISAIYERISIGFVAWRSLQLLLTNYNVEIWVNDNTFSLIISREVDVGFRIHKPGK
jgi:hypothetical protein